MLGEMTDYNDRWDLLHAEGIKDGRPAQLAGNRRRYIIADCKFKETYGYM